MRISHGEVHGAGVVDRVLFRISSVAAEIGIGDPTKHFDYLLPGLQADPANFLAPGPETLRALKALGLTMTDAAEPPPQAGGGVGDSDIPAGYTYFGQFVDHDITFDEGSAGLSQLADDALLPLADLAALRNSRSALLDLDSVYAGAPRDGERLLVGAVTSLGNPAPPTARPAGKGDRNDLPRKPPSPETPGTDREALIGDPRNDENVIIAQLHTAFLKAHNTQVDRGEDFVGAQRTMRRLYQAVVLHDFLRRICDPATYEDVLANGPRIWRPASADHLFMPAEFAAAGYRFGHSMIRTEYDFNLNFNPARRSKATLDFLFVFTALNGQLGGEEIGVEFETLPENWIIDWDRFLDIAAVPAQRARAIDTLLTHFLFKLRNTFGKPEGDGDPNPEVVDLAPKLAVRNLLRGYLFRLPTGQAVARAFGVAPLAGETLRLALPEAQRVAAVPFLDATPLWFYVLAEAGAAGGQHLGPVGSRIVAETFWNLIRYSADSILDPGQPHAPAQLSEIIALAAEQD
ncbi:MAG: hypothetical protein B7Z08_09480 [Sphingomonadales bacterium 32-68-7]|nr:MAG: hypothetical protein B7Z33_06540 [Sphingomonadales bacterium 12-68-11]OYX08399.1 MAG: hypothetical protein B7Z08_09480 [Sphingomonadales bacterium 32-68-7]